MPTEKSRMKDFVLERFSEPEVPSIKQMVERARDAVESYIVAGIEKTMNRFNETQIKEIS
jgi:peptidyl-tRNA hydrolase